MSHWPLISDPYNNNNIEEFLNPLDEIPNLGGDGSWSLYQEILQSQTIINNVEGQHSVAPQLSEKGSKIISNDININSNSKTTRKIRKRKISDNNDNQNATTVEDSADDQETSIAKKLHHNAKERIRRMKVNASYLALRSLMPDSRRSKRWSAPSIIDRVLNYIPELQSEVKALKSKKETAKLAAKAKKIIIANNIPTNSQYESPAVFLNRIKRDEAIIQICIARSEENRGSSFTNLLQSLEDEGICIKSSSVLVVCERRICCNLHVQVIN
ncbi:hypothetical protein MIMGU_mgv1a019680mg [Erythranthe guttata]|uniref:BHLH domain-containing protein n=1 Tax=Erythranthe guttata TaxID=4155 RepID=A0A022QG32_ERYGU|nr:hypothetical protein MIMGU_mgv1a019680mg [Erythranthe guttata]